MKMANQAIGWHINYTAFSDHCQAVRGVLEWYWYPREAEREGAKAQGITIAGERK